MIIKSAAFIISNKDVKGCPAAKMPEYAFIGRSNVGKSSLINMLTNQKGLAKTSSTPGKTQLINHFLINGDWYLVDLPGYGYAKASKTVKSAFGKLIQGYISNRTNLMNLFVLIDIRLEPQKIDLEFLRWLGENEIPFTILFTKADKVSVNQQKAGVSLFKRTLEKEWEALPPMIITSSETGKGREDVLDYINQTNLAHRKIF